MPPRRAADILHDLFCKFLRPPGFLSHLRSSQGYDARNPCNLTSCASDIVGDAVEGERPKNLAIPRLAGEQRGYMPIRPQGCIVVFGYVSRVAGIRVGFRPARV